MPEPPRYRVGHDDRWRLDAYPRRGDAWGGRGLVVDSRLGRQTDLGQPVDQTNTSMRLIHLSAALHAGPKWGSGGLQEPGSACRRPSSSAHACASRRDAARVLVPGGSGARVDGPKAMATLNVSHWDYTAVRGHCGPTTEIGDCSAGESGSFGGRGWSSWSKAAHWCLQRCARCARCQFISVSLAERDCGWYASCSKLHDSPRTFRSGPALPKPRGQFIFQTGLSFNSSGMRLAGPRSSCYVALGLLSAPLHQQYRSEARQTWLRAPNVGQSVHVHFVMLEI